MEAQWKNVSFLNRTFMLEDKREQSSRNLFCCLKTILKHKRMQFRRTDCWYTWFPCDVHKWHFWASIQKRKNWQKPIFNQCGYALRDGVSIGKIWKRIANCWFLKRSKFIQNVSLFEIPIVCFDNWLKIFSGDSPTAETDADVWLTSLLKCKAKALLFSPVVNSQQETIWCQFSQLWSTLTQQICFIS
jgi:hypothetical protein